MAILKGVEWCLSVLTCISLVIDDAEQLFMCLFAVCISYLETILFPLWSGSLYFSLSIVCLSVSSSFLFPHSTPGSFQRTSGIPFVSFSFITSKENLCHCIPCMIFLSSGSPGGQTVGENGLEAVTFPILSSRENADGDPQKPSE